LGTAISPLITKSNFSNSLPWHFVSIFMWLRGNRNRRWLWFRGKYRDNPD
jgi:hypothetical protein